MRERANSQQRTKPSEADMLLQTSFTRLLLLRRFFDVGAWPFSPSEEESGDNGYCQQMLLYYLLL
jgi:hypothetical protein